MRGKFRAENDYFAIMELMIEHCGGVGKERQTSTRICAEDIGVSKSVVGDIRKVAERVGGMTGRYEGGPKGKGGRKAYWIFHHDAEWIKAQAMEQFGIRLNSYDIEHKMPKDPRWEKRQKEEEQKQAAQAVTDDEKVPATQEEVPDTQIAQQLRSLRKSEPEALIEAARQYMGREAFIKEELKRFADMGITIDESAIKVEKDPVLEATSGLVEYIDALNAREARLRATIEKLQGAPKKGGVLDRLELDHLKEQNSALQQTVYDLRKSAGDLQAEHRRQVQAKDRRIQELEKELQRVATTAIQNIAAAH